MAWKTSHASRLHASLSLRSSRRSLKIRQIFFCPAEEKNRGAEGAQMRRTAKKRMSMGIGLACPIVKESDYPVRKRSNKNPNVSPPPPQSSRPTLSQELDQLAPDSTFCARTSSHAREDLGGYLQEYLDTFHLHMFSDFTNNSHRQKWDLHHAPHLFRNIISQFAFFRRLTTVTRSGDRSASTASGCDGRDHEDPDSRVLPFIHL